MTTIGEQIKNSKRWIEAERDLGKFRKNMELIKQYPIKPIIIPPSPTRYGIADPFTYRAFSFW
jgi:hypothetical protein